MKITRSIKKEDALKNLILATEKVAKEKSSNIVNLVFTISTIRLEDKVNIIDAMAGLGGSEEVFHIAEPKINIDRVSDGQTVATIEFMKLLPILRSKIRQGFKDYKFQVSTNNKKVVDVEGLLKILL